MAYVAPTTRSDGYIVAASEWNQSVVNNILYLKNAPTFDGVVSMEGGVAQIVNVDSASVASLWVVCGTGGTAKTGKFQQYSTTGAFPNDLEILTPGDLRITPTGLDVIITGRVTATDNIGMVSAKKLYLDGVAMSGDTHIAESVANTIALTSGGVAITIVSGVLNSTLELKAASAATAVSGFVNGLNLATWDTVGFESTGGVRAVFGGYRAAQWTQVGFATSGTEWVRLSTDGGFGLKDGITAPATLAGFAVLYVDTADGDLKVKFGDGTVKTIVVDT